MMGKIENYITRMKANHHFMQSGTWIDIVLEKGRKYVKVVSVLGNKQRCAVQFVDPVNGNIYKANSWRQKGRLIGNVNNY